MVSGWWDVGTDLGCRPLKGGLGSGLSVLHPLWLPCDKNKEEAPLQTISDCSCQKASNWTASCIWDMQESAEQRSTKAIYILQRNKVQEGIPPSCFLHGTKNLCKDCAAKKCNNSTGNYDILSIFIWGKNAWSTTRIERESLPPFYCQLVCLTEAPLSNCIKVFFK